MGSNGPAPSPAASNAEDEIVVVVTGFGPFKSQYPINPSWSIAASLPPFIPLTPSPPPLSSSHAAAPPPRIRLVAYPSPVRVSYATVRALVPDLWARYPVIDFMVHVGMAGGRDFYSVERRGHRDGYLMADVDGVVLGDERGGGEGGDGGDDHGEGRQGDGEGRQGDGEGRQGDGEGRQGDGEGRDGNGKWVWEGCPEQLETSVNLDDVWRRWRDALPDIDVRPSEDAGRYLCDFIYYSSLVELWKRDEERRVVFLHVPVDCDEVAIARGREVLIELVRALVQSRAMGRVRQLQQQQQQQHEKQGLVT